MAENYLFFKDIFVNTLGRLLFILCFSLYELLSVVKCYSSSGERFLLDLTNSYFKFMVNG